ncbi:MAG: FAD-dependent oxidoreductase [bacterium]
MARRFDYELVVIGGGIGGLVASVTASSLGKKVAIVEKRRLGGNCTSLTCIPSKALVRAGHVNHLLEKAREYGLGFPGVEAMDKRGVMARVRSVVEAAYAKDLPETFEAIGIKVISGRACFLDRHHVKVEGTTVSSEKFIIAAGTRPLIPKIPGLEEVPFLTNESVYQLETLPESILILGGGADGLEYACAFRNLGMDVTVVQRGKRLLPRQERFALEHAEG